MPEDDIVGSLGSTEKHCEMLRNRGLEDLTGYYEWFEANTKIRNGDVVELPLEKLDEQDYFDEPKALYLLNAFLLGSSWEKENPAPITDYAKFPGLSLERRLLLSAVGGTTIHSAGVGLVALSFPWNFVYSVVGLVLGIILIFLALYYRGETQ